MKKQNKLGTYLAVTAGAGCACSVATGAVTFYGPGAQSPDTTPATPEGFSIGGNSDLAFINQFSDFRGPFFQITSRTRGVYFSRGTDIDGLPWTIYPLGIYRSGGFTVNGAELGSDQNYANISFENDYVFEAVGQFFFDGAGGGYLVALAVNEDGSALSVSDGVALIEAASVPEPSSLALLALGSVGLAARRQRKKAA